MIQRAYIFSFVLSVLVPLFWVSLARADQPRLIIVGNDAPPYRDFSTRNATGLYIDPVRQALGGSYKLEFRKMPFARALEQMRNGKADMMLGPNRTPEREEYMIFSRFHFPAVDKVFLQWRYTRSPIETVKDIDGLRIGYLRGATYRKHLDVAGGDARPVNDLRSTERLLLSRRLDAVMMTAQEAKHWLMDDVLHISPYVVSGKKSHIAVSRRSPFADSLAHIDGLMMNLPRTQ